MSALHTLYAFEDWKTLRSRRLVAKNGTVRGTSVKTENPPRAGRGAECEEAAEYDLSFLRGAIAVSLRGGSVESYAETYQGSVKLARPNKSE